MNRDDLEEMDREELQELLQEKQNKYEEVERERKFVLKQTGRHIPGTIREEYKIELNEIKAEIEQIEKILADKKRDDQKV